MVGGKTVTRKRNQAFKEDVAFDVVNYGIMTASLIVVLYPLLYILGASFSDPYKVCLLYTSSKTSP